MFACAQRNLERFRPWFFWATDAMQLGQFEAYTAEIVAQRDPRRDFVYVLHDGPRFAGTVGLHNIDWINRIVRIGYWLDAAYERRGIMTAAVRAMVTKSFTELDLNRVEIRCAPENAASRAIPTRLGFTEEGTHRQVLALHGGFQDLVMYAMLRSDWHDGGGTAA
jgi:ribosomal-protein-serine acetyltransferase